ncbi:MAG: permeases of the drug/metabolite transporter (DMT) superfamily [uncultured archaeon A07HR60]|nr:MAG: permeases of the drug/metabolite transporter (DMT) superfamily [uncultured archaeon A07HR60]
MCVQALRRCSARAHSARLRTQRRSRSPEWDESVRRFVNAVVRHPPPILGLAVATLAISTGAILVRLSNAPSVVAAFYRVLFTTVPLLGVAGWKYRDDFRRIRLRDFTLAVVSGLALAIHFASWFESLSFTSVAASVTFVQSQPLFVAAGAWLLLRERVTSRMTSA